MNLAGGTGVEYLATAFFSAVSAVFGYLARRAGKENASKLEEQQGRLEEVKAQTNGQLEDKIRRVIREEVSREDLIAAVTQENIRNYLDGLLLSHLSSDEIPTVLRQPGEGKGHGHG